MTGMGTKAGRHPDKALTAVQVRTLQKPGRYADGNGLYLVVEPSGAKRWLLRTVIRGKRRDMGLGGLSIVSLAEAREKALAYRKLARGGRPLGRAAQSPRGDPNLCRCRRTGPCRTSSDLE